MVGRSVTTYVKKHVARVALFAMLFSALSPALAAALFHDRPEILRHMLALPAPVSVEAQDDGCPHEAAQGTHHAPSNSDTPSGEHAKHGIYCSFCLAAGSVVAVPVASATPLLWVAADTVAITSGQVQPPLAILLPAFFSRGPPVAIR